MIITIGREHGSNGHIIAHELAERLGYRCFDKELVDAAAENSSFSKELLDTFDEKRVSPYFITAPGYMGMDEGFRLSMEVASAQFQTIRELAKEGNCIFVGRCADYVLRNRQDVLRVFIMADERFRTRTMMERRGLSEEQAKKLIRQVDKDRASFYKYYTDQIWGDRANFDLCINSGRTGVEGAVALIESCLRVLEGQA